VRRNNTDTPSGVTVGSVFLLFILKYNKNISKNDKKLLTKNNDDVMIVSKERLEKFNGGLI